MCMKATCSSCSKASWVGCGSHIPSVMDRIPEKDRCSCEPKVEFEGKEYPPKAGSALFAGIAGAAQNIVGWATGSGKKTEAEKKNEL